jgi:phage terminase large subunit GpA-like protein
MMPAPQKEFIRLRPGEIKVFRRRKRLPGPEWMERNIYVPVGSRQGLYRNSNNPAMYGVLDWATRAYVRVIVMAKGIQVGGTLVFHGLMLREGEYSSDNALVVMADEKSIKKLSKKRLQTMIDKSASLSAIKSSNPDDTSIYSITLAHGFTIDLGWASSEMSVSSESYRVLLLDEISKYKTRGNIEDGKARTTVFADTKKVFMWSSPGIDTDDPENRDPLMVEAEACDIMMDYHAICPDCGTEQVMTFEQFRWPGQTTLSGEIEADPKAIRRTRSVWYECTHCQSRWNDWKRDKAVLTAMKNGWKPTEDGIEFPQSIYFHFPSWLSPYVSLSDVVADWLEAQGDEEKLRKWNNRHAGVSHIRKVAGKREPEMLLKFKSELPRNLVPPDTAMVALLVDTQQASFYYEVWALGYAPQVSLHMMRHGIVETFADIEGMLAGTWLDHAEREYRISGGLIDSGGTRRGWQKHSRTVEVYEWCSRNRVIMPIKGGHGRAGEMISFKMITTLPGTNKAIPGGLNRANIRVDLFKDELENRMHKEPDDPGALSFHDAIDEPFARHFTAEHKDKSGDWIHDRKQRNDYWDCAGYALAFREMIKLRIPLKPGTEQPKDTKTKNDTSRRRW